MEPFIKSAALIDMMRADVIFEQEKKTKTKFTGPADLLRNFIGIFSVIADKKLLHLCQLQRQ